MARFHEEKITFERKTEAAMVPKKTSASYPHVHTQNSDCPNHAALVSCHFLPHWPRSIFGADVFSFFEERMIRFKVPAQFPKIKMFRILLSINLNFSCSSRGSCCKSTSLMTEFSHIFLHKTILQKSWQPGTKAAHQVEHGPIRVHVCLALSQDLCARAKVEDARLVLPKGLGSSKLIIEFLVGGFNPSEKY